MVLARWQQPIDDDVTYAKHEYESNPYAQHDRERRVKNPAAHAQLRGVETTAVFARSKHSTSLIAIEE